MDRFFYFYFSYKKNFRYGYQREVRLRDAVCDSLLFEMSLCTTKPAYQAFHLGGSIFKSL